MTYKKTAIVLVLVVSALCVLGAGIHIGEQATMDTAPAEGDKTVIYDVSSSTGYAITVLNLMGALESSLTDFAIDISNLPASVQATDTEAEIEAIVDLQDLQGAVTDSQVPDDITITEITVTDDENSNDNQEVVFTTDNSHLKSDGDFNYNPSTGTVSATEFSGGGSGLTGVNGATITVSDNENTDEANAVLFTSGGDQDGGDLTPETDGDFTYNPSTGTVSATGFSGSGAGLTSIPATGLATQTELDWVPVSDMEDGAAAAAALATREYIEYRAFADDSTENLEFAWQVPGDITGSTIKLKPIALLHDTSSPGSNEGVVWSISACSVGSNDNYDCTWGTAATSSIADLNGDGYVLYDVVMFDFAEITPTNMAPGEILRIRIERDHDAADDDYGYDIGLMGVRVKYQKDPGAITY